MGAHNVLPTIPSFSAGSPALADLNNLSYAASFLIDHDVRPAWKFFSTATQAIGTGSWVAVQFSHVAFDSDSTYSATSHGAVIVTQGYYLLEACVSLEATANQDDWGAAFVWSPTNTNPHFAAGPLQFGYKASSTSQTSSAAADNAFCISAISPYPAYPADLFQVVVYNSAAHTLDYNQNTSFSQGRFSTQFTGRWVREGS